MLLIHWIFLGLHADEALSACLGWLLADSPLFNLFLCYGEVWQNNSYLLFIIYIMFLVISETEVCTDRLISLC